MYFINFSSCLYACHIKIIFKLKNIVNVYTSVKNITSNLHSSKKIKTYLNTCIV